MERLAKILITICVISAMFGIVAADEPKRVAVLIGIDKYQQGGFEPIQFAEKDAMILAEELQRHQFTTTVLTGRGQGDNRATLANIQQLFATKLANLGKDDVAVVALLGHGRKFAVHGDNKPATEQPFFCPADANLNDLNSMLNIRSLLTTVLGAHEGKSILLIDACRSTPTDSNGLTSWGMDGRLLETPKNTAVIFSCRAGQKSYEDPNNLQQGVFTYAVQKSLKDIREQGKAVTWFDFAFRVSDNYNIVEVELAIPQEATQEPLIVGHLDNFVIAPGRTSKPDATKPPSIPNVAGFWRGIHLDSASSDNAINPFTALLIQQGDAISGMTLETNTADNAESANLAAAFEGTIKPDGELALKKVYEGAARFRPEISYQAKVSTDANPTIEGTWASSGKPSGRVKFERMDPNEIQTPTGLWYGRYFYPNGGKSVDFQLFIVPSPQGLTGFIKEPNTFGSPDTAWLYANVKGTFDKASNKLEFIKTYDGTGGPTHPVTYRCELGREGRHSFSGGWELGGNFGSDFVLRKCIP